MTGHSGHTANAFAFFANAKAGQKNAKELPSQRTKDTANNGQQSNDRQNANT
jgi:hypothetical protein